MVVSKGMVSRDGLVRASTKKLLGLGLGAALVAGTAATALAADRQTFADRIGNTTAFQEPASTYLHCMVVLTAYDAIPEQFASLDDGTVKKVFKVSKDDVAAAAAASEGYATAFSNQIASLQPPLTAEQQLAYTAEFNTAMSGDMAGFLAAPDHGRCLSYAQENGITP